MQNIDHVVFIVPFSRNRLDNLKAFVLNMHTYLQSVRHKFTYRLLVVEQANMDNGFNKGRLINTAFKHIQDTWPRTDCVVIHDVDIVPSFNASMMDEHGDYRW